METAPKHRESWKEFLKRKQINFTVQTYFIDALGAMAFGLFCLPPNRDHLFHHRGKNGCGGFQYHRLLRQRGHRSRPGRIHCLCLKSAAAGSFFRATVGIAGNELGGPVGALVATIVAAELGKLVSKETRVDILVTPGVTIISGVFMAQFEAPAYPGS